MPGAYAHLTLVNLIREPARLESRGFTPDAITAVLDYFRFCELGAVSPDYPYLAIAHPAACEWADRMHYQKTGEVVKAGVGLVRKLEDASRQKAFSWLLGYASHVVTDVTIHLSSNSKWANTRRTREDTGSAKCTRTPIFSNAST